MTVKIFVVSNDGRESLIYRTESACIAGTEVMVLYRRITGEK